MKLEVISWVFCPYVHRVTALLHEKQASFELKYVDLANNDFVPSYLKRVRNFRTVSFFANKYFPA